jgi:hypothetical protein
VSEEQQPATDASYEPPTVEDVESEDGLLATAAGIVYG